jgi:hypothetical protein
LSANSDIENILAKADKLLYSDMDRALKDAMKIGEFPDPHQYRRAKSYYVKVLDLEPANEQAKAGLEACEEMLRPLEAWQTMLPLPGESENIIANVGELLHGNPPSKPGPTPWELRRSVRKQQHKDAAFTATALTSESDNLRNIINKIVAGQVEQVNQGEQSASVARALVAIELKDLYQRHGLPRKGFDNEMFEEAIIELHQKLGLELPDSDKLESFFESDDQT